MADIFTYLDYRLFLQDSFEELKATRNSFSHRAFAKMAGFSSSNFPMLVMQGKRNLSTEGIHKVAKALKLRKSESEFFEHLVRFDQASSDAERNFYYSRIASNRRYVSARPLEKEQFEYYSKWYVPVIREMLLLKDFDENPAWIASRLNPNITAREAEEALKLLKSLGLIARDESGKLKQQDPHIASGDDVASLAMANFQREMIELAAKSIDVTPAEKREIGSVTFTASEKKLEEAKRMMREFRSKLASFLAEESEGDEVYQLNFQLFNLSKTDKKE